MSKLFLIEVIVIRYGISFSIGYLLLLNFDKAEICRLLTVIGGFIVAGW